MKMNSLNIMQKLDKLFFDPKCELIYSNDYELLIATMLSAQSTDKRVNEVTSVLFSKYDIYSLKDADILDIERIIKPVGTFHKKAIFIKKIAKSLVDNCNGKVPNNKSFLIKLPGVGRKTINVVLANLYNVPGFAVDTHVIRISKILGLADYGDDVITIEKKLNRIFPKDKWNRVNNQLILFGRYICKAKKPLCNSCSFNKECKKTTNNPNL